MVQPGVGQPSADRQPSRSSTDDDTPGVHSTMIAPVKAAWKGRDRTASVACLKLLDGVVLW
jgi:hypothetical protein